MKREVGCLVFPASWRDGNCESCYLVKTCKAKHVKPKVTIECHNCGFSLEVYEIFATELTNCPVCGNEYE